MATKKIFCCLVQTFGDVVLGSTLCRNIKLRYPDSEITFVTGQQYVDILKNNPDITRLLFSQPGLFNDILVKSKMQKFDEVYLPYMRTHEDTLWHHQPNAYFHLVDFYAKRCDDLQLHDRRTFIYPDTQDQEVVAKFLTPFELLKDRPLITIHGTSPVPSKSWGAENFSKLARWLEQKGFAVMQVGTADDHKIQSPFIIDARGRFSARQTAQAIAHSVLYVGIDSGPAYLADSMRVPSIILYGATTHIQAGPLSKLSVPLEPLRKQEHPCGPGVYTCSTHCQIGAPCILNHEFETVTSTILNVLRQIAEARKAIEPVPVS